MGTKIGAVLLGLACLTGIPTRARPDAPPAPLRPLPAFVAGADVSYLAREEQLGAVYKDHGRPGDALLILKAHGYNLVRLRLWVAPRGPGDPITWTNVNDLAYTVALGRRVKADGLRLLLDLHYSDTWADPGHQTTPAAWQSLPPDRLARQVEAYTRGVIAVMRRGGAMPDLVAVGNEISNGMLWPGGHVEEPGGWAHLAVFLKAGIRGVEAGSAPAPAPRIMIHINGGADAGLVQWFFDNLNKNNVPFDVIGLSYYPDGEQSLADLRASLTMIASRYDRPVIIAETAYPHDGTPGQNQPVYAQFGLTPAGQGRYLSALVSTVKAMPQGLGRGVIYWEPDWVPIAGLEQHNGSNPLFDDGFNALPGLDALGAGGVPAGQPSATK